MLIIRNLFNRIWIIAKLLFLKLASILRQLQPYFGLVQLLLIIFTIRLTFKSMEGSEKFASSVESHLTKLDSLFASVENKISDLPKSMAKFDSSVSGLSLALQNQQEELKTSIGGLRSDVDAFSDGLTNYEQKLVEIAKVSDKQLDLIKKTQEEWEKQLSRKPNILIKADRAEKLGNDSVQIFISINNLGNQVTKYTGIVLYVPKEYGFTSKGWICYDSSLAIQSWSYQYKDLVGYSNDPQKCPTIRPANLDFTLVIKDPTKEIHLKYIIYHDYGSQEKELLIKIP